MKIFLPKGTTIFDRDHKIVFEKDTYVTLRKKTDSVVPLPEDPNRAFVEEIFNGL